MFDGGGGKKEGNDEDASGEWREGNDGGREGRRVSNY